MGNSIERIDRVLELIGDQDDGLTHAQIAKTLDIPKSSLTLLIKELIKFNYLSAAPPGNRYILGPRLLLLAGRFLHNQDIVQIGRPILGRLVDKVDETAFMAVRNGLEVVYVMRVNKSNTSSSSSVHIGQRAALHKTAAGKAILAFQSDQKIGHIIGDLATANNEEIDAARLKDELMDIRQNGVSYCLEEFQPGINSLGAPVFNLEGRVVAAITVAAPTVNYTPEVGLSIAAGIREAAGNFSAQLGFDGAYSRERKSKKKL